MSSLFSGQTVSITGGTGSFGSALVDKLLKTDVSKIKIFSRDEMKQDSMRRKLRDDRLHFFLGDVRDKSSVETFVKGTDYLFHAAALKQVPSCEFFPMQAVATNVNGSHNVISLAYELGIKGVVCLSTDKAAYPINAMGMSKALMEKIAFSFARDFPESETRIAVTRYGNVMMSRGSVIPLFIDQVLSGRPVTVTNRIMTRFLMSLSQSVDLVIFAFENASSGDLFIHKAPGCSVESLINGILIAMDHKSEVEIIDIGIRHGEKQDEVLLTAEEMIRSKDLGNFYRVPLDARSLDYEIFFEKGQSADVQLENFNSRNTVQLNSEEVASLLLRTPEFCAYLNKKIS